MSESFIFIDCNYPEVYYYGDERHMQGLVELGGCPSRREGPSLVGKRPGDVVEVEVTWGEGDVRTEHWDVVEAPAFWAGAEEEMKEITSHLELLEVDISAVESQINKAWFRQTANELRQVRSKLLGRMKELTKGECDGN